MAKTKSNRTLYFTLSGYCIWRFRNSRMMIASNQTTWQPCNVKPIKYKSPGNENFRRITMKKAKELCPNAF
jgi:hypothetical protein